MKEFKGTQGPWVVDENGVQARWNIDDVNGNSVALTHQLPGDKDWQKRDANTHLIAAAPELLEALQEIISGYEDREKSGMFDMLVHGDLIEKANAAINKAMGEQQ